VAGGALGLLLALSFPHADLGPLALLAFVPLLAALGAAERGVGAGFRLGLLCGVVFFAALLYWIPVVMVTYGGLSWRSRSRPSRPWSFTWRCTPPCSGPWWPRRGGRSARRRSWPRPCSGPGSS